MEHQKTILVTGITGNQGSAVAENLLDKGHSVIGLTRDPNSIKAKYWKSQGVKLIAGDLEQPEAYQDSIDEVNAIYLVQALQKKKEEIHQAKEFINALPENSGLHLVYASVLGADLNTGVPHFDSKFEIENYIKSKALNYTILRPASFYENHLFPRVANDIRKGKFISPLRKDCKQQMIGVDDIGKIAASVISNKEKYQGKIISIATDEWRIGDIPEVFSEALKRPVDYKKLPGLITRLAMGKDLYKMFKYMNRNDFSVVDNIKDLRNEFNIQGDFKNWVNKSFISITDPNNN